MKIKLTKKQVVQAFKMEYKEFLQKYKNDSIAKRMAFHDFVDGLHKEGELTDNQANNWTNPF